MRILFIESVDNYLPRENNHPPLGLGYLANSLRMEYGDKIIIKIINNDVVNNIKAFQPDIVGISSVSKSYDVAKENARTAKQAGVPVIIGGVHISFLPQTLTPDMDVGIMGEGEKTIVDVIASFLDNNRFVASELVNIAGVVFWDRGDLLHTKARSLINNIDDIPFPARDLLSIEKHASMITSRGCPYNCAFCSTSRHTGNRIRPASAEYVVAEIAHIYKQYGVDYITIYDDMFAVNTERVATIVDKLGAIGLLGKIGYALNIRTDFVTEEMAGIFKRMNVKAVGLGVETGCQSTLDYLKSGGITVEDNANAIRILKKRGIKPYCAIIIGSPHENKADLQETIAFIKNNNIEHMDINVLTPFPGTPMWNYAESRGWVSNDMEWKRLNFNINYKPIILSEHLDRGDLLKAFNILDNIKKRAKRKRQALSIGKHPYKYIIEPIFKQILKTEVND